IREKDKREAIAIVYTDLGNQRVAGIPSSENSAGHPYLKVNFTDGRSRSYDVANDATMYRPRAASPNLVVSDGYPRRVYLRAPLDSLAKDSAVHTAHIRFHIVPNSFYGTQADTSEFGLIFYIPDSTDPKNPTFKTGQRITDQPVRRDQKTIDFPM